MKNIMNEIEEQKEEADVIEGLGIAMDQKCV